MGVASCRCRLMVSYRPGSLCIPATGLRGSDWTPWCRDSRGDGTLPLSSATGTQVIILDHSARYESYQIHDSDQLIVV